MDPVSVGIDLGTTNSCVGILQKNGQVKIIPIDTNSTVVPSWVTFANDGVHVGQKAKDIAHLHIKNSIYEFKRLIGEKYNDPKIEETIKSVPYKIVKDNETIKIEVDYEGKKKQITPEELSSYVLAYLKDISEKYIGKDVERVVVTVPAYFNDYQRQATKTAAFMAGFKVINIINEPTAAALAFTYHNPQPYKRNVLVYDFGGGTFDVSIVRVGRGECIVKATKGNSHLGGTDIDANLVNYVRDDFKEQYNSEVDTSEVEIRRLKRKCERVKIRLSGKPATPIEMSSLSGKDYYGTITKTEFNKLNETIFQKTLEITEACLNKSGLSKDNIDEVVLVGGSSRIPKVQTMLSDYFGEEKINHGIHPDEAVAYGAAIHASNLLGNKKEVKDVISMSLGIELLDKSFSTIIENNTPIPETKTRTYCTISEDTSINIYQGEASIAEQNFKLGSFVLCNVDYSKIEVTFKIDDEGILKVTATSKIDENNTKSIVINVTDRGLTSKEIEEHTTEIKQYRDKEVARSEFYKKKWELQALCKNTIDNVDETDQSNDIMQRCSDIVNWLESITIGNKEEVDAKRVNLEKYLDHAMIPKK